MEVPGILKARKKMERKYELRGIEMTNAKKKSRRCPEKRPLGMDSSLWLLRGQW